MASKKPVLTVQDMREQVAANTSVMQLVAKQQLEIVNAIVAVKGAVEQLAKSLDEPVSIFMAPSDDNRMDSRDPHPVGDQAVPEASD